VRGGNQHMSSILRNPRMFSDCGKGFREMFDHSERIYQVESVIGKGQFSGVAYYCEGAGLFRIFSYVHAVKLRFNAVISQYTDHSAFPYTHLEYLVAVSCNVQEASEIHLFP